MLGDIDLKFLNWTLIIIIIIINNEIQFNN